MKKYPVVLRIQKLKSTRTIHVRYKHNTRAMEVINADPDQKNRNISGGVDNKDELKSRLKELLPTKLRSNAVVGVEYIITANQEYFKENQKLGDDFLKESVEWLKKKHGAKNVVTWDIHYDESAPHLHAIVIPTRPDGKLDASYFFGNPEKMRQLQTDIAEDVAKRFDLTRGLKGSKARHKKVKQYYAEINQKLPEPPPQKHPKPKKIQKKELNIFERAMQSKQEKEAEEAAHAKYLSDYDLWKTNQQAINKFKIDNFDLVMRDAYAYQAQRSELDKMRQDLLKVQEEQKRKDDFYKNRDAELSQIYKDTGKLIKKNYTPAELEEAFGVKLKGKQDIFDYFILSGRAENFQDAVRQVTAALPSKTGDAWNPKIHLPKEEYKPEAPQQYKPDDYGSGGYGI